MFVAFYWGSIIKGTPKIWFEYNAKRYESKELDQERSGGLIAKLKGVSYNLL